MTSKPRSKRITCRKRYKIIRKIKEHHRKVRKADKTRIAPKKEPGIPNSHPLKLEVLKQLKLENDHQIDAEKISIKASKSIKEGKKAATNLADLAAEAELKLTNYDDNITKLSNENPEFKEQSLKSYSKEFKKVIEAADVIIEVLDARDPLGSRSKIVEDEVLSNGPRKHLVLLLNKIDLIPKEVAIKWLSYLRHQYPTFAFKSSTQSNKEQFNHRKGNFTDFKENTIQTSACIGAETLVRYLKKLYRSEGAGTALSVGVVGYPNVGKSSVINSLKRTNVCTVGIQPGVTKSMQEVKLDQHLRFLDCPGVVFPDKDNIHSPVTLISSCVKNQQMKNPNEAIEKLLSCCSKEQLLSIFEIPNFDTFDNFLTVMAKRFGKLKKGGLPDRNAISKVILNQWSSGKIKYYIEPPSYEPHIVHTKIVDNWKSEFEMNPLPQEDIAELDKLTTNFGQYFKIDPNHPNTATTFQSASDSSSSFPVTVELPSKQEPKLQLRSILKNKTIEKSKKEVKQIPLRKTINKIKKTERKKENRSQRKRDEEDLVIQKLASL